MDSSVHRPDASRTIAVGDVHGCAQALAALVEAIDLQPADALVVLGDVVDRGPDSRGALELLIELAARRRVAFILGNHEQMLLDAVDGLMPIQEWLAYGGAATLDSYGKNFGVNGVDPRHIEFLRTWDDYFETPGHFFAHANYLSNWPLASQPWDELRWQSLVDRTPTLHQSGKTAVLGHTSQKDGEILNLGYLVCIDTYCCGGRWLTALDVGTGDVWQSNEAGDIRRGKLPAPRAKSKVAR